MSRNTPVLGTAALQNPATQRLNITKSTCTDFSVFKDVMREYRRLDDTITMRMNRNGALFRDSARTSGSRTSASSSYATSNDDSEACLYFWKQLVANWKARSEIIDYCVEVLDTRLEEKERSLNSLVDQARARGAGPNLFEPKMPDEDRWRGPTNEFYRANSSSSPLPSVPATQNDQSSLSTRELQDIERRRREKETDVRASLYEERVKKDLMNNEKTVEAIVRRRSYEAFRSRCKFFEPPTPDPWWDRVTSDRQSRT
ncbi:hypothetical protein PIIN_00227 [Serendipita indica DSM 11827]|uniref:Uncharacterized protein n=1 Tax=Serendipita indica (strain DSM 11827) TaxID=1109443 RepID=G4T5E9_SERID|nr:hypothetical protein PIIN_00227 [Serendipita indica DSM 11827]